MYAQVPTSRALLPSARNIPGRWEDIPSFVRNPYDWTNTICVNKYFYAESVEIRIIMY